VLAARDLAGPAWLEASGDDPDVAAFTALQATLYPPEAAEIDKICARVLWARYAPYGAARDGTAGNGARPGQPPVLNGAQDAYGLACSRRLSYRWGTSARRLDRRRHRADNRPWLL
jgi:hypothetical protein